jgi:parallel beta-helix repeat protein
LVVDQQRANAADRNVGTAEQPFKTIGAAAGVAQPGDTVLIHAGTYREAIHAKNAGVRGKHIVYMAAAGEEVVVTGADIITGWEAVKDKDGKPTNVWVHHGWDFVFVGWNADMSHGAAPPIGRCEQVIVDGVMYRQVLRKDELVPGTFLADPRGDKALYVVLLGKPLPADQQAKAANWWDNPVDIFSDDLNKHQVQASTRNILFDLPAYTEVKGLTFRYAANRCQEGPVSANHPGDRLEDVLVEWMNGGGPGGGGMGKDMEDRVIFTRVISRFNGQMGMGGYGNIIMDDCVLWGNNVKGISGGWEAGGMKLMGAHGAIVRGMRAIDNAGPGIWFDTNNRDNIIEDCYCEGNYNGIMIEVSGPNNIVRNNIVVNSRDRGEMYGVGILVQLSDGTLVANNTLVGNEKAGVMLRFHPYAPNNNLRDNRILNNLFVNNKNAIMVADTPVSRPGAVGNNSSDYNLFFTRLAPQPGWTDGVSQLNDLGPLNRMLDTGLPGWSRWGKVFNNSELSLEEWQKTYGYDMHSIQWDPMLVDAAHGDMHPMTGSVALGAGIALPEVTDDYFGHPRPQGERPTIGAVQDVEQLSASKQYIPGPPR